MPTLAPRPNSKKPDMPPPPKSRSEPAKKMGVSRGILRGSERIVLYGPGGVGKSELASLLKDVGITPLYIDIENGSQFLDVARIDPSPTTFEETRQAIRMAAAMDDIGAIVVDSLTRAEEMAVDYTIRTVKNDRGEHVSSIEGYGFGKGYTYVYESFLLLLQELDAAARAGKHIIGISHDCTATVPNPSGEDFIRYEPRLQSPPSGKGSIRHRVKEWCDHLFYIGFDTFVEKGITGKGKASGSGMRTIYPCEMPTHWAKSRLLSESIQYARGGSELWRTLFQDNQ